MVTKSVAIANFLKQSTHTDLAELYNLGMEVQVNVAQDAGERVAGEYQGRQWQGWQDDDGNMWKPFRIPYKANTKPEYTDRELNFSLTDHAEGIGMTGWDWQNLKSRWVAFDFDAIVGHSDKHTKKMDQEALDKVQQAAIGIPWVTVRKSTSGKGLHLYVYLDLEITTENHHEHAALARSILGIMSAMSKFDFNARVDTCGGNMWVWHRKMKDSDGLTCVKKGIDLTEVPPNWKDHVKVVSGRRRKARPSFLPEVADDDEDSLFDQLTGQHQTVPLDDGHKKLIDWLNENKTLWWWDPDHHMMVTHTFSLQRAHEALGLKGIFKTISKDDEGGQDHNCFCYPMRQGSWVVRRFSAGAAEVPSWDQDAQGYTRCFLNREPDLKITSRSHGGIEKPSGGFVFREGNLAAQAALSLGVDLGLPGWANSRSTTLKQHKDGRLVAEVQREDTDAPTGGEMGEWLAEGKLWKRVFNKKLDKMDDSIDMGNFDDVCRHVITEDGGDQGWVFKSDNWIVEPLAHLKVALQALGHKANEVGMILGSGVFKPWTLVNVPFQPEYLGDRKWNRDSPQLRYKPSDPSGELSYPHWTSILNHLGQSLDNVIKENGWCKANGLTKGADYLKCWVASIFQSPLEPLPYLFFWSDAQNTGKSVFHEAIELLMTKGYARADSALQSQQGFNGELANSVLCVVEETDLKKNLQAYNRIKDWVTARKLPIHKKGKQPYLIPNSSHWIQCANSHTACPIFQGDTRITMIHVDSIDPIQLIPKRIMMPLLEKEAPDFLASILSLEMPESPDRLALPAIETSDKLHAALSNMGLLDTYLKEMCFLVPGAMIKYSALHEKFKEWLDPNDAHEWTKVKFGKELPPHYPKGRVMAENAQFYIGNISFNENETPKKKLVLVGEKLVHVE